KAFRIDTAEGQQAKWRLPAEGNERHGGHARRLAAKQIVALTIAQLPAARLTGGEQRIEAAKDRILGTDMAQEARRGAALAGRLGRGQQQHGVEGVEILAQAR